MHDTQAHMLLTPQQHIKSPARVRGFEETGAAHQTSCHVRAAQRGRGTATPKQVFRSAQYIKTSACIPRFLYYLSPRTDIQYPIFFVCTVYNRQGKKEKKGNLPERATTKQRIHRPKENIRSRQTGSDRMSRRPAPPLDSRLELVLLLAGVDDGQGLLGGLDSRQSHGAKGRACAEKTSANQSKKKSTARG
ncbi:hypothetical protein LX36DRAFT_321410 [Colletotrichum falcatum]|nr:hypothetical protein LX36DRAFT_321410 [Colletotrichum falcatum]